MFSNLKTMNRKKNRTTLQSPVDLIIIVFLTIILPLLYFRGALDPVLIPRLLLLNVFLAGFYFSLFWRKQIAFQDFSVLRRSVFVLLFGYFLITVVSGAWAINFREGIFDMVKTFAVFSLVAVLALVFNQTSHWQENLVKSVIVAAFLASIIGFIEYFQKVILAESPFLPDGKPVIYSVAGLMAHRNMFSNSLLMMLPFIGFGFVSLNNKWKWAAGFSGILLLVLIFLLKTRSVWLAIVVAVIMVAFIIIIFYKNLEIRKKTMIILLTTTIGLLLAGSGFIRIIAVTYPNKQIGEIAGMLDFYSAKNFNRFRIYNVTTEMIADQPLTGVGAGNWKIRSPEYFRHYHFDRDQLNWIRPHNDFLWVFSEKGIIGLFIFIGIFALTFVYLIKSLISNIELKQKVFTLFLVGGLIGYVTDSMFTFPLERVNQQVYLSLIIASAIVIFHQAYPKKPLNLNKRLILSGMLPFLLFGIYYCAEVLNMEYRVKAARNEQFRSNWPGLASFASQIPQTLKNVDLDGFPISWYAGLAATNMRDFETAVKEYEKAKACFPNHVKVLNNLGQAYIETGNYQKGLEMCQKALSILSYYPEAFTNSAAAYLKMGQPDESFIMLLKIREHDRSKPLQKLMNKVMMHDSFIKIQQTDINDTSFCGNIISKYQRFILTEPTWHNDVMAKAKVKNINFEIAVIEDACVMANRNEPDDFLAWYGVEYYESVIQKDSTWLALVREKSGQNHISLESQLSIDASYVFSMENRPMFKKYHLIKTWKQKILTDNQLTSFIKGKSETNSSAFEEMLDVYAGHIADLQIKAIDPEEEILQATVDEIKRNADWYQKVIKKAKQTNQPLEETLWKEAYYATIQDN